ncbi:alpha/beta fold hydrolase [Verrucosispora sp. WMMC514]|uniref:lipase family alpha/beta hydrolase n=1 Tax=Verrucosispora sp. WMMC514 TaxID=3015156 RepID=UPI00248B232B|nr:alpha/beta fold hydrolase [Verrucosispora sp. WMMC514]WBB91799.1 lipase [Verrucosispora sp. WMMC514]
MLLRKAVPVLALTVAAVLAAPAATAAPPATAAPTSVATTTGTPAAADPAGAPDGVTGSAGTGASSVRDGASTGGAAPADVASTGAAAPADVASTGAAALADVASTGAAPADVAPTGAAAADNLRALAGANPVIVVGGLSGIAAVYEPLAARLRADGYRVWIYQLPNLGLGDITASAAGLRGYVGQVRAAAAGAKVDLVAHSEGGLVSRYYIKNLGGGEAVERYVSLGTPQYGTYVANIVSFLGLGSCAGVVACQQMTIGSSFLTALNAGDDTPAPVRWTTVRTWQDELVRPVDNAMLADGATNVLIQSRCPLRVVGHLGLVLDGTTYTVVRQALRDAAISPNCLAL